MESMIYSLVRAIGAALADESVPVQARMNLSRKMAHLMMPIIRRKDQALAREALALTGCLDARSKSNVNQATARRLRRVVIATESDLARVLRPVSDRPADYRNNKEATLNLDAMDIAVLSLARDRASNILRVTDS